MYPKSKLGNHTSLAPGSEMDLISGSFLTHVKHTVGLQFILAYFDPEQVIISLQCVAVRVAEPIHVK